MQVMCAMPRPRIYIVPRAPPLAPRIRAQLTHFAVTHVARLTPIEEMSMRQRGISAPRAVEKKRVMCVQGCTMVSMERC